MMADGIRTRIGETTSRCISLSATAIDFCMLLPKPLAGFPGRLTGFEPAWCGSTDRRITILPQPQYPRHESNAHQMGRSHPV